MENEKSLIDAIKLDFEEICGSATIDTDNNVEKIVKALQCSDVSSELVSVLEEYRTRLSWNAECASSQRYVQRIQSAEKRRDGIFFLEDHWGKKIKTWLADNSGEVSVIESLDNLYNSAPKGKPTKKWSLEIEKLFSEFSEKHVLGVVRYLLNILVETNEVLKSGVYSDNERKLKPMVYVLTLKKYEEDAELLKKLALVCYTKVPYEGPISTGVGNACLQGLSELSGEQGLVHLSELARKIKYPASAAKFAKRRLEEAAKEKGVNIQDLESMVVPDYGLIE